MSDKPKSEQMEKADYIHVESTQNSVQKKIVKPEALIQYSDEEIDEMHKKVTRKVDIRLLPINSCFSIYPASYSLTLPMLVLLYILNYLDRNNIASALSQYY